MILVDSNVIIDVLKADVRWASWSATQLSHARAQKGLVINAVIYAELSADEQTAKTLDLFLDDLGFQMPAISKPTARMAGEAYAQYRKRQGSKTGVLADFFIGAQAMAEGWTLLTRDRARYKTYFPQVPLICPP